MRSLAPLIVASLALPAAAQELVTNGGFESPTVAGPWAQRGPGVTFGGWQVDNLNSGIAQVASFGNPAPIDGLQCVELNFNTPCGISQTLATEPGRYYTLAFLLAGQTNAGPDIKSMRIDWGGTTVTTVDWSNSQSQGRWQYHEIELPPAPAAATVLHFFGLTPVDGGPYLDAVSVTRSPCRPDVNQDGNVDQDDVAYLVNVIGGGDNPTGIDPDFNEDGNADQDDLAALINRIAGGGCP